MVRFPAISPVFTVFVLAAAPPEEETGMMLVANMSPPICEALSPPRFSCRSTRVPVGLIRVNARSETRG